MNIFKSRKFKHGSLATALTVCLIAAVVLVNVVATLLLERFPWSIDLTGSGNYSLSEEAIEFAEQVQEEVTITVLYDKQQFANLGGYYEQCQILMEQFPQYNPNIKIRYMDLYEHPEFESQYPNLNLEMGNVIVESARRTKLLTFYDLLSFVYNSTTQQVMIAGSTTEQAIVSALLYVTDENPATVSVLTGHEETDLTALTNILASNSYQVVTQNILREQINPEADMVVICAPMTDYTDEEMKKLDAYLNNGGQFGKNLIYIASADQSLEALPNLMAFLEEWGIAVTDNLLVETDTSMMYYNEFFSLQSIASNSDYSHVIEDTSGYFVAPYSREVETLFSSDQNRKTQVLIQSSESTVLLPYDRLTEGGETWDPSTAEKKQAATAAVGLRSATGASDEISRVFVFGSAQSFDQSILSAAAFNNAEYILGLFNTIFDKEDTIQIVAKELGGLSLNLSAQSIQVLTVTFMFIVPILVLAAGIGVWFYRRHL